MLKPRRHQGFSLVELLVAVVVIGIIISIAMANYTGAQKKAKTSTIKSNMHEVQIAAESYATDATGCFGPFAGGIDAYLPGGGHQLGGSTGQYPNNPYTGKAQAASPPTTSFSQLAANRTATGIAATGEGAEGIVGYQPASSGTAGPLTMDTYTIDGADDQVKLVLGTGGSLVLSNQ